MSTLPDVAADAATKVADAASASAKVFLAISSFRNDEQIARLLNEVQSADSFFDTVLVVDSMGTQAIPDLIAERGWDNVRYHSYDQNLGSAGNLTERLRLAAEQGADYVYAINHDGMIDLAAVRFLVRHAAATDRIGAAYSLRYVPTRDQYDLTGLQHLPLFFKGRQQLPEGDYIDVHWGSSNGALYATAPVRQGILPRAELWMGWEDFYYGWELEHHGFRQILVLGARTVDSPEYEARGVPGGAIRISVKSAWYTYYRVRNLMLIARWSRSPALYASSVVKTIIEFALTVAFRKEKSFRLKLLLNGISDGLRHRTGKGKVP